MAAMSGRILRAVQRRPVAALSMATVAATVGGASFVEYQAKRNERLYWQAKENDKQLSISVPTLPRKYSWNALNDYWSIRPISTVARLVEIGSELFPLMALYVWDFVIMKEGSIETTRQHAQKWRHALTNLGPAFVKAGQQLSIRPDLVPPAVLEELQQLCDSVRPVPDHVAMATLQEELGGQLPESIYDDLKLVASAR
jgi:hypothetical protein